MAKEIEASLTIYHAIRYNAVPIVDASLEGVYYYGDVIELEAQARREEALSWVKMAKQAGVEAVAEVNDRVLDPVAETIVRRAGTRDMIAMAAHTGRLASVLLGSLTRQVVRSALCPVWVIHTQQKGKAKIPLLTDKAA